MTAIEARDIPQKDNRECSHYLINKNRYCRHRVKFGNYECYQHRSHKFDRPRECPICLSTMYKYWQPLQPCQHWVCPECIIHSGKRECPYCRVSIKISPIYEARMKLAEKFHQEEIKREQERLSFEFIEEDRVREVQEVMNIVLAALFESTEHDDSEVIHFDSTQDENEHYSEYEDEFPDEIMEEL